MLAPNKAQHRASQLFQGACGFQTWRWCSTVYMNCRRAFAVLAGCRALCSPAWWSQGASNHTLCYNRWLCTPAYAAARLYHIAPLAGSELALQHQLVLAPDRRDNGDDSHAVDSAMPGLALRRLPEAQPAASALAHQHIGRLKLQKISIHILDQQVINKCKQVHKPI